MKFVLVEGSGFSITCKGCGGYAFAGTTPYRSATGQEKLPERVYANIGGKPFDCYYHESCAAKIASADDPTRSINQFFENTAGTVIMV